MVTFSSKEQKPATSYEWMPNSKWMASPSRRCSLPKTRSVPSLSDWKFWDLHENSSPESQPTWLLAPTVGVARARREHQDGPATVGRARQVGRPVTGPHEMQLDLATDRPPPEVVVQLVRGAPAKEEHAKAEHPLQARASRPGLSGPSSLELSGERAKRGGTERVDRTPPVGPRTRHGPRLDA
jgi:hypothetical protein